MFENTYFTFLKIQKTAFFYVFLKWHVKKRRKRYQSFRMITQVYQTAGLYTVRCKTTNNYIYIQRYIKLWIKIWP